MIPTFFISLIIAIVSLSDTSVYAADTSSLEEVTTVEQTALTPAARHTLRSFGGNTHPPATGKRWSSRQPSPLAHAAPATTIPRRNVPPYLFWRNLRI